MLPYLPTHPPTTASTDPIFNDDDVALYYTEKEILNRDGERETEMELAGEEELCIQFIVPKFSTVHGVI